MPSLSVIGDSTALRLKYIRKVIVYVESESDVNLYKTIVGPGYDEFLDFQKPPEKGTGCGPARAYVEKYRPANSQIYALLDGEAVVPEKDGFTGLVKATASIFSLNRETGILFLADHEAENILIRQADIVSSIVDQVTLANLGRRQPDEVEMAVDEIVQRQFEGALCKYTSYRLHSDGKITGVLAATHLDNLSEADTLNLLQQRVSSKQCDWQTFTAELVIVQRVVEAHLELLTPAEKIDTKRRLADGKMAMKIMQKIYNIAETWQGALARKVALTEYARRFRQDLFTFTNISVAA
ncbi:hypothetical protein AEAC466_10695 [Asticcacaulis sp. AC466]|uniref:hypothetical protein n=1 Tax=Asticcacaulis sp. AC466 TaxID=1282362 RepID=UPI0003C3E13F|nr:hypothetical protein [Asticcacaulis sp. AC466]ESQ84204.1 hypothetical protein AEAC466_10695 [Asticcacaulis sp. AC466]